MAVGDAVFAGQLAAAAAGDVHLRAQLFLHRLRRVGDEAHQRRHARLQRAAGVRAGARAATRRGEGPDRRRGARAAVVRHDRLGVASAARHRGAVRGAAHGSARARAGVRGLVVLRARAYQSPAGQARLGLDRARHPRRFGDGAAVEGIGAAAAAVCAGHRSVRVPLPRARRQARTPPAHAVHLAARGAAGRGHGVAAAARDGSGGVRGARLHPARPPAHRSAHRGGLPALDGVPRRPRDGAVPRRLRDFAQLVGPALADSRDGGAAGAGGRRLDGAQVAAARGAGHLLVLRRAHDDGHRGAAGTGVRTPQLLRPAGRRAGAGRPAAVRQLRAAHPDRDAYARAHLHPGVRRDDADARQRMGFAAALRAQRGDQASELRARHVRIRARADRHQRLRPEVAAAQGNLPRPRRRPPRARQQHAARAGRADLLGAHRHRARARPVGCAARQAAHPLGRPAGAAVADRDDQLRRAGPVRLPAAGNARHLPGRPGARPARRRDDHLRQLRPARAGRPAARPAPAARIGGAGPVQRPVPGQPDQAAEFDGAGGGVAAAHRGPAHPRPPGPVRPGRRRTGKTLPAPATTR